jgi:hypothetical protein
MMSALHSFRRLFFLCDTLDFWKEGIFNNWSITIFGYRRKTMDHAFHGLHILCAYCFFVSFMGLSEVHYWDAVVYILCHYHSTYPHLHRMQLDEDKWINRSWRDGINVPAVRVPETQSQISITIS